MFETIVIGGGASGLMAALHCPLPALLIERQSRVGRKLLSTGNGRCNLTNLSGIDGHYHGADPSFLTPALTLLSPADTRAYFASLGLLTVEEYGGRVYPLSNHASSVLDVLRYAVDRRGVQMRTGTTVQALEPEHGQFRVYYGDAHATARRVILACGGCAGGKVGGVSDGYRLMESLGHHTTRLAPALCPLHTRSPIPKTLKGIRTHAALSLSRGRKTLSSACGDLLFTDTGISGTAVFDISRAAASGETIVHINFLPDLSTQEILAYLQGQQSRLGDGPCQLIFTGSVHSRIGQVLCQSAGLANTPLSSLTAQQLETLARLCTDFTLPVTEPAGFDVAQVTVGGLRTSEFYSATLQSRLHPGLYACGEILDIDGDCGGFNLQWAWSSGYLAGQARTGKGGSS